MRISPIAYKNFNKINFRYNNKAVYTNVVPAGYVMGYTFLFREPTTDEYVQNHIRLKAQKGEKVKLVSGGCASGEEIMSYACMLDDVACNVDFCAFDIEDSFLEKARGGFVELKRNTVEQDFLLGQSNYNHQAYTPSLKEYQQTCIRKFKRNFIPDDEDSSRVYLRKDLFNRIKFSKSDARKIDQLYEAESVDVLLFRNVAYHLLCQARDCYAELRELPNSVEIANNLACNFAKVVKPGGLVVFSENDLSCNSYRASTLENAMVNNGFKLVHYNVYKKQRMNFNFII